MKFTCSWNGCIPVTVEADSAEEAREAFAQDASEQTTYDVDPADVEVHG